VSCTGSTNCVAVGDRQYMSTIYAETLVETWNGTAWHSTRSPNPQPAQELRGVACTSGSSGEAVGNPGSSTDAPEKTLVEIGS
jgi:hypothetical protein